MRPRRYQSWGRYPDTSNLEHVVRPLHFRNEIDLTTPNEKSLLPFGNGRSYGDTCLNDGGVLLDTRGLDRFIRFDAENGVLRCEAGVLLSEIIELVLHQGWFLTVTPGTRFVTVGGAIANDVHGKNHHRVGTFGCYVKSFELLRSDGQRLFCSRDENSRLFAATIGGLGLTGVIVWAEILLRRVDSSILDVETQCFGNLEEFFNLSGQSDIGYEYTVAWVDCLAKRDSLGRGVFIRANHRENGQEVVCPSGMASHIPRKIPFPLDPRFSFVNVASLKVFNALYRWSHCRKKCESTEDIYSFFYPLDSIYEWNRIYGKKGFLQYQCVAPIDSAREVIGEILERISDSGQGSFLAVLKVFGIAESPGMLSFPRAGITLALDFPNRGAQLFKMLDELDQLLISAGGAIYPAKDARMSGETFRSAFPEWREFEEQLDPAFSSSFWRRVMGITK